MNCTVSTIDFRRVVTTLLVFFKHEAIWTEQLFFFSFNIALIILVTLRFICISVSFCLRWALVFGFKKLWPSASRRPSISGCFYVVIIINRPSAACWFSASGRPSTSCYIFIVIVINWLSATCWPSVSYWPLIAHWFLDIIYIIIRLHHFCFGLIFFSLISDIVLPGSKKLAYIIIRHLISKAFFDGFNIDI